MVADGRVAEYHLAHAQVIRTAGQPDARDVVDVSVSRSYADAWDLAYASGSHDPQHHGDVPATTRVLWWVAPGDTPTPEEAVRRLDHLERHGPGPAAFTLRSPVPPPRGPVPAAPPTDWVDRRVAAIG